MTTQIMTGDELNRNIYLGKTATIPRPAATDTGAASFPDTLARHQQMWDAAKAWADEDARIGQERRAKLEAGRTAEAERQRTKARADLEAAVKQRFMAQRGVTVSDWERLKGELIDRELISAPNAAEVEKARLLATGRYPRF